jgi:hypothetical protein
MGGYSKELCARKEKILNDVSLNWNLILQESNLSKNEAEFLGS